MCIKTGFTKIDEKIGELQGGELYIVGGRPSMGKTSFALNIADFNVIKNNKKVCLCSLQHKKEIIMKRLVCSHYNILSRKWIDGFDEEELNEINDNTLEKYDLFITKNEDLTVENLIMEIKESSKIDLLIIDYLQLLETRKQYNDRTSEVDYILRKLKELALTLNIPILIVSTLTRKCEIRENKRPLITELRDTGSIEDIAHTILLIYRDEYYNADTKDLHITEIIVAKSSFTNNNRSKDQIDRLALGLGKIAPNGETVKLGWLPQCFRFGNLDESAEMI